MSPSWNNSLFAAISPSHISMLKLGRGFKPRIMAKFDEAFTPPKQSSWETALDKLAQQLSQPEWQKAEMNVVLSNRLLRFETLNFGVQLSQYTAQEAFAKYALGQTYGAISERWTLRIQPAHKGDRRLVSAIDQSLLDSLRQACAAQQLKLKLVTPYLIPVFNRFQKQIQNEPTWLVLHEPGYSLLVLLSAGQFVAVNGVYHDSINELPVLLDRENLVSKLAEPCFQVCLYSTALADLATIPKTQYQFNKLELAVPDGFPSQADGLYSMLMSECL